MSAKTILGEAKTPQHPQGWLALLGIPQGLEVPVNIYQCRLGSDTFPPVRTVRVLLVDDSEMMCEAIGRVVRTCCGLEIVATAGDGVQALEAVRLHRPDLVMMDVQMPHMNGLEAAARIRDEFPGTRVVLFSTYNQPEYSEVAEKLGAVFVPKSQLARQFCELFAGLFGRCQERKGEAIERIFPMSPSREYIELLTSVVNCVAIDGQAPFRTADEVLTFMAGISAQDVENALRGAGKDTLLRCMVQCLVENTHDHRVPDWTAEQIASWCQCTRLEHLQLVLPSE